MKSSASVARHQPRTRRYAWNLDAYLRSGGTLEQLFVAFQDNYIPLLRDRGERRVAPAATGMTGATFCKGR